MSDKIEYWSDLAERDPAWCIASPDGTGPHRPDDTTEPLTCAECGTEIDDPIHRPGGLYDTLAEIIERGQSTEAQRAEYARLREERA